jgi:hypothetical protein
MNESGEIVGMVDVLKLTYATLEQINTMSSNDGEGPAWNKFWLSLDHETESALSGDGSHHHTNMGSRIMSPDLTRERITDSVAPGDSASHAGAGSPRGSIVMGSPEQQSPAELPFPFKFKAPSNRVHRIQVIAANGIGAFVTDITVKLGAEVDGIGGAPTVEDGKVNGAGFALSYMDDEGDYVGITTDVDLQEAILLARRLGKDKVDLFVHDPDKPPVTAISEPVALPTPPLSTVPPAGIRERRRPADDEEDEDYDEDEEDESVIRRARRTKTAAATAPVQDQVIAGVPNELLLPGAIVTLAVVIVGVFSISRLSSR